MTELTELAKLDKLVSGKKEEVTMESAMSNNEKIRDWTDHIIGAEKLAENLETKLKV